MTNPVAPTSVHFEVEVVRAGDLRVGDTIWAPDDGDWMKIRRIERSEWGLIAYRLDGSEAAFDSRGNVLRDTKAGT